MCIRDRLNDVLSSGQTRTVLLETMSGKGSEIGKTFEELAAMLILGLLRLLLIRPPVARLGCIPLLALYAVSYTHLDVYKRQAWECRGAPGGGGGKSGRTGSFMRDESICFI